MTTVDNAPPEFLSLPSGQRLAYRATPGRLPRIVFVSGFTSDMTGQKATHLARWASDRGQAFLRFDYSGHGLSDGAFEDDTIGRWTEDTLALTEARHAEATRAPSSL